MMRQPRFLNIGRPDALRPIVTPAPWSEATPMPTEVESPRSNLRRLICQDGN